MKKIIVIMTFVLVYPFIGYTQDMQYYWSIVNTTHDPLLKLEAIDSVFSKSFRKDNGIGYNFSEKYIDSNSLGLKTLLERTKFLKGQMKVHSNK